MARNTWSKPSATHTQKGPGNSVAGALLRVRQAAYFFSSTGKSSRWAMLIFQLPSRLPYSPRMTPRGICCAARKPSSSVMIGQMLSASSRTEMAMESEGGTHTRGGTLIVL